MPIEIAKNIPEQGRALVLDAVRAFRAAAGPAESGIRAASVESLDTVAEHPILVMTREDARAGRLQAARHVGYRYVIMSGKRVVGAAVLRLRGKGDVVFAELQEGPAVQSAHDEIARAEALREIESGSFELRLLKIPSLHTTTLWLHAKGDAELFLPLEPVPFELRDAKEGLSARELFRRLEPRAVAKAKGDLTEASKSMQRTPPKSSWRQGGTSDKTEAQIPARLEAYTPSSSGLGGKGASWGLPGAAAARAKHAHPRAHAPTSHKVGRSKSRKVAKKKPA